MRELNVYHHELRHNEYEEFYLKYEADEVISEKDAKIRQLRLDKANLIRLDDALREELKSEKLGRINDKIEYELDLRHNKYKRCLAMARWCRECSWSNCIEKVDFYYKWYNRWLELAEKFKEADK